MGDERHSKLEAVPPRVTLTPEQEARQATANGLRQFDELVGLVRTGIAEFAQRTFRLRPSTLVTLDRIAVEGLVDGPGHFRRGPIKIGGAKHKPPDAEDVSGLIDEMCEYVNDNWGRSAVHLAAYVMWRLNWIHAFEDGNGRTARAASYLVLCVRLRTELPGSPTIPELIAANKTPYYEALEAADTAFARGRIDVSQMETLLQQLLMQQLTAAATGQQPRASVRTVRGRSTSSTTSSKSATRGDADPMSRWMIGLLVTIATALIMGAATMLSTPDGQSLLRCSTRSPGQQEPARSGKPISVTRTK